MTAEQFWQELKFRCGIVPVVDDLETVWCELPDGSHIQIDRPDLLDDDERRDFLSVLLMQFGC